MRKQNTTKCTHVNVQDFVTLVDNRRGQEDTNNHNNFLP